MDTQTKTIERTTLSNLIYNEDYARKVLPFIKGNYFEVREERIIFEQILNFVDKYKKIPTQTSLEIEVGERKDLSEIEYKKSRWHNQDTEPCGGRLWLARGSYGEVL